MARLTPARASAAARRHEMSCDTPATACHPGRAPRACSYSATLHALPLGRMRAAHAPGNAPASARRKPPPPQARARRTGGAPRGRSCRRGAPRGGRRGGWFFGAWAPHSSAGFGQGRPVTCGAAAGQRCWRRRRGGGAGWGVFKGQPEGRPWCERKSATRAHAARAWAASRSSLSTLQPVRPGCIRHSARRGGRPASARRTCAGKCAHAGACLGARVRRGVRVRAGSCLRSMWRRPPAADALQACHLALRTCMRACMRGCTAAGGPHVPAPPPSRQARPRAHVALKVEGVEARLVARERLPVAADEELGVVPGGGGEW